MWPSLQGKLGLLQARQRVRSCRSMLSWATVTILSPSPSKRLEYLGPRLCHSWGSWEGGSRLRLGNHGRCSSCSRESLWQCRGATRQQWWALHPPQTLFTFNYGAAAVPLALSTSNFYCYLFINIINFSILLYIIIDIIVIQKPISGKFFYIIIIHLKPLLYFGNF